MNNEKTVKIQNILKSLPGTKLEGLKKLFWEELNYNHDNSQVSMSDWTVEFHALFHEHPVLFASAGTDDSFHIIYCHLQNEKMLIGIERQMINKLIRDYPYSLFIFSNHSQTCWHFVNAIYERDEKARKQRILRRISVSPEDRLRTASERITRLDTVLAEADLFGVSPIKLQEQHEDAFNVEAVTEEFFKDYKEIYKKLKDDLYQQFKDQKWSHDLALQFMNRLMFIYYIERKRWLDNDPDFLHNFWRAYCKNGTKDDSFVSGWLNIMFFEAFNNQFSASRSDLLYIPEKYRDALQMAPYLNGGLFTQNELDDKYDFTISDTLIGEVFEFLDHYNFTISEDTPLDQEVAVDPEMIGKVYESLVNVSEEADEQGDAGIFYTPRVEIDLMCRLSLVDWLANQFPLTSKAVLYEFVFAFDPEEKQAADQQLTDLNLWPVIERTLNSLTLLDPACGSGSFLVGMLMILDDLLARCANQLGKQETPYERRKRIIGHSLYGVDIMEWAVHVAELRLWLQLVIDTDLDVGELKFESRPLLPNLSFKIRRGDSLVQEIGGMNIGLRRRGGKIRNELAGELTSFKGEKLKFFNNEKDREYFTKEQVEHAEYRLFCEIIEAEIDKKEKTQRELEQVLQPAKNLFDEVQTQRTKPDIVKKQQELVRVQEALLKLRSANQVLSKQKVVPFVWDMAFIEIFEGDKKGFDIVIGNPPYVRQEKIHDPALSFEKITKENKSEYKNKLAQAVEAIWPYTFSYNPAKWELNKKSDYYIYFYFIGLSLLNEKGSFCFITSNSWLDVGYGSDLQRFLLTRGKVKLIIDNQVKRSFKSADVNTIIALLGFPIDSGLKHKESLEHHVRFVMFKVPFEQGLSPVIWEEVEEVSEKKATEEYRVMVKPQSELLETGLDPDSGVYAGDKWGGKYLRAPDIYWVIMEKCKDKLVRLGDIAEVRRGITTGANEFFYLDEEKIKQWGIEEEFLKPVIKSSRECKGIKIDKSKLSLYLFYCHEPKAKLKGTRALEYIKWGENQYFSERPSCNSRRYWWNVGERNIAPIINPCSFSDISRTFLNDGVHCDKRLYEIYPKTEERILPLLYSLNSTLTTLFLELGSRTGLGEGLIDLTVYELANCFVYLVDDIKEAIKQVEILSSRKIYPIDQELSREDRIIFDQLIFSELGFNEEDIRKFYNSVLDMVQNRLKRAEKK